MKSNFRPLRKPNPNKNWMKGFSIPETRKDIPLFEMGQHSSFPGTSNFKSTGGRSE
jgi:hypothetical protein